MAGRDGPGRPPTREDLAAVPTHPGLCATCRHARILASKTSVFLRCGYAEVEPDFPKYPRLPVRVCAGYEERAS